MAKHWSVVWALVTLGVFVHINIVFAAEADGNFTAILPKPGACPRLLRVDPSLKVCACDEDCPAEHKCCMFGRGAVCVPPAFKKPGVCPRRTSGFGLCAEFCSDDSDCPSDEKCCSNGCGHECTAPVVSEKPGVCPRRTSGFGLCVEFCSDDSDCPSDEKCCSNGCGHECTAPYKVKPGYCPRPQGISLCAEFCYHDGQCPGQEKCCKTTCGHACSEPC